jgi:tetratricopeptide (TPR) repeat protein
MNRLACNAFFGIFLLAGAQSLRAQQINPRVPPPPPSTPVDAPVAPADSPAATPTPAPPSAIPQPIDPSIPPPPPSEDSSSDAPAAPSGPVFDPLHAGRSMDVGRFYLNKGAYDAAIDRFVEASNYQPTLAAPWKLLGDAYEKKHEYSKAVESYNKYLQILPHAPDAARIKKLISDLEEKIAQESPKKAER